MALSDIDKSPLYVDGANGRVGIGTFSPSEVLEVYGTTPIIQINDRGLYQAQIGLIGNDTEFRGSSGNIEFYTGSADGASSTERLRIDSSGRVGIGTDSPLGGLQIGDATVDANNKIVLGKTETSTQGYFPVIQQTSSDGAGNDLTLATTSSSGVLRFLTGNTNVNAVIGTLNNAERMRIDSSGNVTIQPAGTTTRSFGETVAVKKDQSASTRLSVRNDTNDSNSAAGVTVSAAGNSWAIECGSAVKNGNALTFALDATAATPSEKMRITSGGFLRCVGVYNQSAADSANVVVDSTGNIYRSTSALKYKQDIRDIEEIDISQFRPIRYKSNLSRDDQTKDHFGFIADEAHDAGYTELVSYGAVNEETGIAEVEGFRYDRMTVLLTKVVQQQQETITALEARIAALEAN